MIESGSVLKSLVRSGFRLIWPLRFGYYSGKQLTAVPEWLTIVI